MAKAKSERGGGWRVLTWPEYLSDLRLGPADEVERELARGLSAEDLDEYRRAEYVVIGRVREPELNQALVRSLIRKKQPPLPQGFVEESGEYFTADGDEVFALVAIKGDGMPPQTVL